MADQLQPKIDASEVIHAFQLLYPQQLENVIQVIGNAKRLALIPQGDEDASDISIATMD